MRKGKKRCVISYPTLRVIERAVNMLQNLYPTDLIEWKGSGRKQAEQAVAAARWAFQLSKGQACTMRKLAAAATLFYELITLHPLVDGNKRLATLLLGAFLIKNDLPTPKNLYKPALKIAGGEWSREDVYKWLLRAYRYYKTTKK
ncbi:MAG: Fic family protein [Desulfurococcales archaeon]|nr:Fic family protein [Desulfurococcales archaeon]MCE4626368.1 Fic family protein [Desulfurococcales archaeon]